MLVFGDTNSTLGGALAAAKLNIPVGHVEAGPRQGSMKIPEEINRVLTDRVATLRFAPTRHCVKNLESEGIREGVFFTSDVMYDLVLRYADQIDSHFEEYEKKGLRSGEYLLLTVHRPINTDIEERLESIVRAVSSCGERVFFLFILGPGKGWTDSGCGRF